MLVVLALPPCSIAEEVGLCGYSWTFNWPWAVGFSNPLTLKPKVDGWYSVYDSLFLCACLLKVYNSVHAFQLCIKLAGSLFTVRNGYANLLCECTMLAHILQYIVSLILPLFHIGSLFTNQNWPIKDPVSKCMYIACLCQIWIDACAYGTDILQLNICSCLI